MAAGDDRREQEDSRRVTYYPSCVANLVVRLDEALRVEQDLAKQSQAETDLIFAQVAGHPRFPSGGTTVETRVTPSGAERRVVLRPLVVPNSDNRNQLLNRVPRRATLELPGVRQAWKFSLEFDFRDLPIDPKLVRACGVEVHLGTVPAGEWAQGQLLTRHAQTGQLLSQIRTRTSASAGGRVVQLPNTDTLVMFGTADAWSVQHGEAGSTVTIDGRDLRGVLLDLKFPMAKLAEIDAGASVVGVVSQLLEHARLDYDVKIAVFTNEAEWEPRGGVPSPGKLGVLNPSRVSAGGKARTTPSGGQDRVSYWDLITRYCYLVGAIPYFYDHALWIRPARNVFDLIRDPTYAPPFRQPRFDQGRSEPRRVRRLVYGRDISELSYERKFAGVTVPTIEVASIDESKRGRGKLVKVQWPAAGSKAGGMKAEGEVLRVNVGGLRDTDRMLAIAQDIYEEIGKGEMGGSASTSNLSSFGGDNADPDMLTLRPTDGIELLVDGRALSSRSPLVSELTQHEQRGFDEEVRHVALILDGEQVTGSAAPREPSDGSLNLARALVATARSLVSRSINYFRVGSVRFDFDPRGARVGFDFQSYVVPRHTADTPGTSVAAEARVTGGQVQRSPSERAGGRKGQTPGQAGQRPAQPQSADPKAAMRRQLVKAGVGEAEAARMAEAAFGGV